MTEVIVTTLLELQDVQSSSQIITTNVQHFYRPDAFPLPNQQCQSTEGKAQDQLELQWKACIIQSNIEISSCQLLFTRPIYLEITPGKVSLPKKNIQYWMCEIFAGSYCHPTTTVKTLNDPIQNCTPRLTLIQKLGRVSE